MFFLLAIKRRVYTLLGRMRRGYTLLGSMRRGYTLLGTCGGEDVYFIHKINYKIGKNIAG